MLAISCIIHENNISFFFALSSLAVSTIQQQENMVFMNDIYDVQSV